MRSSKVSLACLLAFGIAGISNDSAYSAPPVVGLRVPVDFEITEFAGDDLAHNIFSLTIDARGRVAVSGPGYVKLLIDEDHDGRADRAHLYADGPTSGATGLYFDGADLIYTGDNSVGRMRDTDGDGDADEREQWAKLKYSEHGPHGIVRGPDGNFYLICGNDADLSKNHIASGNSPVVDPLCGAVIRFDANGRQLSVVADGLRNSYDLDFNATGSLFTVDSDNERDHYLPWYEPTRMFDVAQGRQHGWLTLPWETNWTRPEAFVDNVDRVATFGRGSPTGLVVYRHRAFPRKYQGGVFTACWGLGKIYFCPLDRAGSTWRSTPEIFLESTGEHGFAPVDMAIGPAGEMYIAVGGRQTRGAVYCVRPKHSMGDSKRTPSDQSLAVLDAPQPLSSWSRAQWRPLADKLGRGAFETAATDARLDAPLRLRAVEVLVELFGGFDVEFAERILKTADADLVARVIWAMACSPRDGWLPKLTALTQHPDSRVQRAAWEGLLTLPTSLPELSQAFQRIVKPISPQDRRVCAARCIALRKHNAVDLVDYIEPNAVRRDILKLELRPTGVDAAIGVFERAQDLPDQMAAIRLIEQSLGDLQGKQSKLEAFAGYTLRRTEQLPAASRERIERVLAERFPSGRPEMDKELARLAGAVLAADPRLQTATLKFLTKTGSVEDDLHYLTVLSLLRSERSAEATRQTAEALLLLQEKMADGKRLPSRNWPSRLGEIFDALRNRDPRLPEVLIQSQRFALADHSLFAQRLEARLRAQAAATLIRRVEAGGKDWTSELVTLATALPPDQMRAMFRSHWDEPSLRDPITLVLADQPTQADREVLIESLSSLRSEVVKRSAAALKQLPSANQPAELLAALKALQRYLPLPEEKEVRTALQNLLKHWTSAEINVKESEKTPLATAYRPWFEWFEKHHPATAAKLTAFEGGPEWHQRLLALDWENGDADRGKVVFERRDCRRCHLGAARLGPDLAGATTRFSREDLFTAIVDPSRDVAPPYRTTRVLTTEGKTYHGIVIQDVPDATLLQISPETILRLNGVRESDMKPSATSLMPNGLLNGITDGELADLYHYLKCLRP